MSWKDNKHGTGENDEHCFSCSWYQPWDFSITPPRPAPSAPSVEEAALEAVDPVEPEEGTVNGYCRARSVPITNLNLDVEYDSKTGFFKSSAPNTDHEILNEVTMLESNEFWCRKWVRALHPFAWPPAEFG
jgi:hypothetical protein